MTDPLVALAREFPSADLYMVAEWGGAMRVVALGGVAEISFAPVAAAGRGIYVVRFVRSRGGVDRGGYVGDRLVHVR